MHTVNTKHNMYDHLNSSHNMKVKNKVRRYIDIPGIPGISLISIPAVLKSAQNEYTENTWYTGKVPDKSYTYQKKVRNQLVHAKRLPFLLLIHCLRCLYPAQIPNLLLYTNKS